MPARASPRFVSGDAAVSDRLSAVVGAFFTSVLPGREDVPPPEWLAADMEQDGRVRDEEDDESQGAPARETERGQPIGG